MKIIISVILINLIGCSSYKYYQTSEDFDISNLSPKMFASPSSSIIDISQDLYLLEVKDSNSIFVTYANYQKMFIHINVTEQLFKNPNGNGFYSPSFKLFKAQNEIHLLDQSKSHVAIIKLASQVPPKHSTLFMKLEMEILASKMNFYNKGISGDLTCPLEVSIELPRVCETFKR